jgi:uncharacterized membrane-anchored protein
MEKIKFINKNTQELIKKKKEEELNIIIEEKKIEQIRIINY